MYRKSSNFLDYGIEADIEPKIKFNLLISATISTIMCLAAKCPIPKSNVETTKLFLGWVKISRIFIFRLLSAKPFYRNFFLPFLPFSAPRKFFQNDNRRRRWTSEKRESSSVTSKQLHGSVWDGSIKRKCFGAKRSREISRGEGQTLHWIRQSNQEFSEFCWNLFKYPSGRFANSSGEANF